MTLSKQSMPETMYRASRCCRVMGNPTAYLVLRCLGSRRKTPNTLSEELHIPLTTISSTLRHLRETDLVRYETRGRSKEYWTKGHEVLQMLDTIEEWVESVRDRNE